MRKTKQLKVRIKQISDGIKEQVAAFQDSKHSDLQMTARLAELHEAISELNEISTRRIICLTWFLAILTAVLLAYTVFLYKDTHAEIQHRAVTEQHELPAPLSPEPKP